MSATPIPRSLALSIYGDLDLSIIDKLPSGRKAIKTKWINNFNDLSKMYDFILKKINEGNQAYFVASFTIASPDTTVPSTGIINPVLAITTSPDTIEDIGFLTSFPSSNTHT